METSGTCPRGHAVSPDAVLCTVCWVRLDGEDPLSKRARILSLVSRPAGAAVVGGIVLAAGVGTALMLANPSVPPAVTAGESPVLIASPSPSAAADQPVMTSVPLAGTVASPVVTGPDGACLLDVLDQQTTCRTEGDLLRFEICVSADTSSIQIRRRASADGAWADVVSDVMLLPGDRCPAGGQRADVALASTTFNVTEADWRLVGRDSDDDKLWTAKLRPAG